MLQENSEPVHLETVDSCFGLLGMSRAYWPEVSRTDSKFWHFVKTFVEASVKAKFAYVYNSTKTTMTYSGSLHAYRIRACANVFLSYHTSYFTNAIKLVKNIYLKSSSDCTFTNWIVHFISIFTDALIRTNGVLTRLVVTAWILTIFTLVKIFKKH
jgi:hypothetical protein